MIGVLRSEQRLPSPVEADAIEEAIVGVAAPFHPLPVEIDRPRPLVHVHDGFDVAIAARDGVLESPRGEIVQVQVNPAVALRPPDQLVRARQHAPVLRHADFAHLRLRLLLEQRAPSAGAPTCVRTSHMRLTPRPSCWNVAILRESGDQVTTGSSLFTHPALLVAYPKSSTPSVVSGVSVPLVRSVIQRLLLRMNTARVLSGDRIELGGASRRVLLAAVQ